MVVSHSPEPALRTVAVLDAVINNSDRKGGHLMRDGALVRGCDHGVSLSVAPKLRTVLWGWAGEPLPEADTRVEALLEAMGAGLADELRDLLTAAEVRAVRSRAEGPAAHAHPPAAATGLARDPWPAL